MYDFILGNLKLGNWQKGITTAASWAWGVSVIVGIQVFQQKGIEAFAIWAAANSLTLALLGWLFTRVQHGTLKLAAVVPAWSRPLYEAITYVIQFFSVLVNITAIKTAFSMLGADWAWLPFSMLIAAGVIAWGFGHAVKGNIIKYAAWMALLLFVLCSGDHFTIPHSAGQDIGWALYGALILFCAPVLDQQMWQRRVAFGDSGAKPFTLAAVLFALYMILVGLVAATCGNGVAVAIIILLVASSTLASALSAVSCYYKEVLRARLGMGTVFTAAVACMVFDLSVIQLWTLYGSLRIPFALFAFWVILQQKA